MRTARNTVGKALMFAAMVLAATDAAAQAPAQSFADLHPLIKPGQQVIVTGDDHRETRGRVVSVTGTQLEIERPRWFFRRERLTFTEPVVSRIEHRDSTWNGILLGLAAGASTTVLMCRTEDYYSDQSMLRSCVFWVSLGPLAGLLIGDGIDGGINRTIYVSPATTRPVVTLRPLLGRDRAGVAAAIRF